jgi:hypothetical protein
LADARQQRFEHQRLPLQVMAAIGQVEALVAQWEVKDRLPAHREPQSEPVAERWIDDLVIGKPAPKGSVETLTFGA